MRILVISHEYPPIGGGGATACYNLTKQYALMGHEVDIITADINGKESSFSEGNIKVYKVKCKRAYTDHSSFYEMFTFLIGALHKVKEICKVDSYDIVQVFFGIPSGPIGYYIKRKYKIPYIIRVGGGDIPGTQKRFNFIYKIISPFLKVIWKNAEYVVTNSEGLKNRALNFYQKANHTVIYNGIDLADFPNKKEKKNEDKIKIVTTARLVERKGIQHVLEALSILANKYGDYIQYTIIGDGPYRENLEKMIDEYQLKENVVITGMLPRNDVLKLLCQSDIFVLLSHWEGMPNVVLEAMACRLPIVMSDCEGSLELVKDNGYIIKSGDNLVQEFISKIENLMNDQELCKSLGNNSFQMIEKQFLWEISAKDYLEIFHERRRNA